MNDTPSNDRLRMYAFGLFSVILVASVIHNLWVLETSAINWTDIVLIVLIVFIIGIDKIKKLVISPKDGIIIDIFDKVTKAINAYVEGTTTKDITEIVKDTIEHRHDIWVQLLIIRMTLRRLLRKIAVAHGIEFSSTVAMSTMTKKFRDEGIIDSLLVDQIDKIRDATFLVEWGDGTSPNLENIKFTLEEYGNVFKSLKDRVRTSNQ